MREQGLTECGTDETVRVNRASEVSCENLEDNQGELLPPDQTVAQSPQSISVRNCCKNVANLSVRVNEGREEIVKLLSPLRMKKAEETGDVSK